MDIQEYLERELSLYDDSYADVEYFFEADGTIVIPNNNIRLSAKILRILNNSGLLEKRLAKLCKTGDAIILGVDEIVDAATVDTYKVGPAHIEISIKKGTDGRFYAYKDNKRVTSFKTKANYKRYIKDLEASYNTIDNPDDAEDSAEAEDFVVSL